MPIFCIRDSVLHAGISFWEMWLRLSVKLTSSARDKTVIGALPKVRGDSWKLVFSSGAHLVASAQ